MPVFTLGSSKGGVGKTTLSLILAGELAEAGAKVVIIDADPNQPFKRWNKAYCHSHDGEGHPSIEVISPDRDSLEADVLRLIDEASERASFVIIDLEGTANMVMNYALSRSDLMLIPLQGSSLDAAEAAKALKNVKLMMSALNRDVRSALVFTRTNAAIRTTTLTRFHEEFKEQGIPLLSVEVMERQPYKVMFDFSCTLREINETQCGRKSIDNAIENAKAFARAVIAQVDDKTASTSNAA